MPGLSWQTGLGAFSRSSKYLKWRMHATCNEVVIGRFMLKNEKIWQYLWIV
jgi:hypothetical protein